MGRFWRTTSSGKRVRTEAGIKRQYELWDGTDKYKKRRAKRNQARRSALRSGLVKVGDGKDIDHIRSIDKYGNQKSNLRATSARLNRGRTQGSRKRGSKRKRYGN